MYLVLGNYNKRNKTRREKEKERKSEAATVATQLLLAWLSFSLSSPAQCIHNTIEVNANKSMRVSSHMSLECQIGIALGYCRDGVDDDDIRRTTLHSFVLPFALKKCGKREKKIVRKDELSR